MNTANFPPYFHPYIEKIPEGKDPFELLAINIKETIKAFAMVTDEQANGTYEEGKWSMKELLQHMIDSERIFCFRALAFARGDKASIPGYEQDDYASYSRANNRRLKDLLEELKLIRESTIILFKSFDQAMMNEVGNANGIDMTADKILYIIIGHELHHIDIIHQRYL